MQFNTEGLVLNEMNVGETDRLVTVLTKKEGVLRAFAKQANRTSSGKLAATRLFCYSRLSVYKGRDKYIIDDAKPIEVFFELRKNLEGLTLAQYFCELSISMAPREAPAGDFLRLLLNTLHFLCKGTRPLLLLKSVVELRLHHTVKITRIPVVTLTENDYPMATIDDLNALLNTLAHEAD